MQILKSIIKKNTYYDSATLMKKSSKLSKLSGVDRAAAMMGTGPNLEILSDAALLTAEGEAAQASDLIISVLAKDEQSAQFCLEIAEKLLAERPVPTDQTRTVRTFETALRTLPDANLVLISIPGIYARPEVEKALNRGLHVFLFSDNVSLKDEVELKKMAREKGLLLMGPDCGTAYLNGIGFGFANAVRRGPVGIVAAAGTGLQEVSVILHELGLGVSHGIGVGGRDFKPGVDAMMTRQALQLLENDPETEVILLVAKAGEESVSQQVLEVASSMNRPVVAVFLGEQRLNANRNVYLESSLEKAALTAARLAGIKNPEKLISQDNAVDIPKLPPERCYLRGLFSGGTLMTEALMTVQEKLGSCFTNVPYGIHKELADPQNSFEHTLVDMGEDYFTTGRPHPMFDFTVRVERLLQEAADPRVGCILMDVVLGYGSHPDPAGELVPAINKARFLSAEKGFSVPVIISLLGTPDDIQDYNEQARRLREAGAVVYKTAAGAARAAAEVITRR